MENWVGRRNKGVHPAEDQGCDDRTSSHSLTIKVRMTTKQLKELMAEVDMKGHKSNSELGRVIFQECLEGKATARIDAASENRDHASKYGRGWMLSTICEGGEEEHEHLL